MKFFEKYFDNVQFDGAEEVKVLCPFHSDHNPSASVNTHKNVFHCWVCGVGYSEQQFISKINDISIVDAGKVLSKLNGKQGLTWDSLERAQLWSNPTILEATRKLGITDEVLDAMKVGVTRDENNLDRLAIPVFYNGVLMDVRAYDVLKKSHVKMLTHDDGDMGHVIPYDLWKGTKDTTYIFEGEKDMMLARSLGINAITLTGGADAIPNELVLGAFKDRDVIICYDNDEAGRNGMNNVYLHLKKIVKSMKFIDIAEGVKAPKDDFWDYIMKYGHDVFDFYLLETHDFLEVKPRYTTIRDVLNQNLIKKQVTSQVVVSGEFDETFAVPTMAKFVKTEDTDGKGKMTMGETKEWYLETGNIYQLLELIEAEAKKEQVVGKIKSFAGVPPKEEAVSSTVSNHISVYKARVADLNDGNTQLDVYSFRKLSVGKVYDLTYKVHPHPTKQQKIVVLATTVDEKDNADDFVPNKNLLSFFKTQDTVAGRLDRLYQSAKHHVAKHLNYELWLTTDLVFNSVLEFDYGDRIRGALDIFILGDTQVGKSETTSKLVELYKFGHFLSLKTSTTVGLIGGSNKVENSWLNTIGAIPRQHGKLVVMEEFSGAKPEFLKTMTDIRSSGWLNLARAAGELKAPCRLRMITISNPINDENGNPRHLSTFPNGVAPLMELIKSAEDVARYDGFLLMQKPPVRFNPFSLTLQGVPIPEEAYEHKAQWVYTRRPEHVQFAQDVQSYIWERAEELNAQFECNFPLFGTTSSLKLARFCVAMASLIMSTDDTYQKVIVTREIVDYTVDFLKSLYNNDVFKLAEYKREYDSYSNFDPADMPGFQELYNQHSTMLEYLENSSQTNKATLRMISGLDGDRFNPVFNVLATRRLVRLNGENVIPTPRFRTAMRLVSRMLKHDSGTTMVEGIDGRWLSKKQ